ncbi:helix-turn-helix domain-containing protein [Streptomyces sp. 8L]|uniref:helix-turn-helix domain-containing protein n=1 Tax=Streptomyces sp. 8L TaxID=2877242 RepID=UPI001CD3D839|nr:helix-turn-helix transcriptional regulator [Streptomyces sp. 8L]MCA1223852.1 helix-turn-helix domain-containing protein [Streptomyces sp. 8L]
MNSRSEPDTEQQTSERTAMAGPPERRTDLTDLVRNRRSELGLSLRKLAERCVDPEAPDAGPIWKYAVINRLERGLPVIAPIVPELRALAAGLQLPLGLIQDAAGAQFFGIDSVWSDEGDVRALVHDYRSMSPEDQERVRDLMRTWGQNRAAKPHGGEG